MAVLTPWCPRCGAWRGYVAALCKGCQKIDLEVTEKFPDPTAQQVQERQQLLRAKVQERFVKISEMRTDREAYTQALEEMVEQNVSVLKAVCTDWMRMRPESRRVRFANMMALEMVTVARQALEQVGALSLELTEYTQNKGRHEEIMKQVAFGMQTVEKFINPDGNEPKEPEEEKIDEENSEAAEDSPPGSTNA
jgi:small-conductance mechanosensitive channel